MDGLSQQAETSQMQEKKAGIQASLADAKADSPAATMENRVAAVGQNMSHADAAEQAAKDRSTAQGQKASKEDLAAARAPHEAKARERADEISVSAKNSASLLNSSSSPNKIMHAQSDLRAASAARQMISDHEGATQLDQMADNLGKAKSASSAQQSSNPSSPDSSNSSQANASTQGQPTPPATPPDTGAVKDDKA